MQHALAGVVQPVCPAGSESIQAGFSASQLNSRAASACCCCSWAATPSLHACAASTWVPTQSLARCGRPGCVGNLLAWMLAVLARLVRMTPLPGRRRPEAALHVVKVCVLAALLQGREAAESIRERWETSDSPLVHRIQVRSVRQCTG